MAASGKGLMTGGVGGTDTGDRDGANGADKAGGGTRGMGTQAEGQGREASIGDDVAADTGSGAARAKGISTWMAAVVAVTGWGTGMGNGSGGTGVSGGIRAWTGGAKGLATGSDLGGIGGSAGEATAGTGGSSWDVAAEAELGA